MALFAVFSADDQEHGRAAKTWRSLSDREEDLVTSNYVLVETFPLFQNRLGLEAVRALQQNFVPLLRILWIGEKNHEAAMTALLTAGRKKLSLVDCVSFEVMRRSGLTRAFAFDRHFAEQGFQQIP